MLHLIGGTFVLLLIMPSFIVHCAGPYEGYQLWEVIATSELQLMELQNPALIERFNLDFWSEVRHLNKPVLILVKPGQISGFREFLGGHGIQIDVLHANIQSIINQQTREMSETKLEDDFVPLENQGRSQLANAFDGAFFDAVGPFRPRFNSKKYNSHSKINQLIADLARDYSNHVQYFDIGTTHENRTLRVMKIQLGTPSTGKAIWIDAGSHAREWISVSTAVYIMNKFATELFNPDVQAALGAFTWYFLPVLNPDGYEFSRVDLRLWRKNKRDNYYHPRSECNGVDLNRNWGFKFNSVDGGTHQCQENYQGPEAFSEPETRAVSSFLFSNREFLAAYFTFHSFGKIIGYSWSYQKNICPPDIEDLDAVAEKIATTIEAVNGNKYEYGSSADLVYPVGGVSNCWAKGQAGIPFSYIIELPPCLECRSGFLLNESYVAPYGEETFRGIVAGATEMQRRIATPSPLKPDGSWFYANPTHCRVTYDSFHYPFFHRRNHRH